jgi:transglutaminase-like putative cysteine protease
MQYTIRYETRCHFDKPASYSIRNLHVTPREEGGLRIAKWHISTPGRATRSVDAWGNTTHLLTLTEPHEELCILVTGVVELPDEGTLCLGNNSDHFAPQTYLTRTQLTQTDQNILQFARTWFGKPPVDLDTLLTGLVKLQAHLRPLASGGETLVGAVRAFERQSATVQDHVHTALTILRSLDLPARFVSGYLLGTKATEYAWADVWLEREGGWVSLDIRQAQIATGRLIRLAVGRDYLDACPMRSARHGGGQEDVRMTLQTA